MGLRVNGTPNSQEDPVMPGGGGGDEPWEFADVPGDGAWFDPPMVPAYRYETDGQSNFTQTGIPEPATMGLVLFAAIGLVTRSGRVVPRRR